MITESIDAGTASRPFESKVLGISGSVRGRSEGGPMSRGDRATLRRMLAHDDFPPDPFWGLIAKYGVRADEEAFWRVAIPLMVLHPHRSDMSAGRALAVARTASTRIERWLRLDRERAHQEAHRLLSKVDGGFDWVRFGRLLRSWDRANKMNFARNFYLSDEYQSAKRGDAQEGERG